MASAVTSDRALAKSIGLPMDDPRSMNYTDHSLPDDKNTKNQRIQSVVTNLVETAQQHYKSNLEPDQAKATNDYWGRKLGNERPGRSSVVSTDVRDAVLQALPNLLRVFTGSDRVVLFKPDNAEDAKLAEVQTEYVNYVFLEDNEGFLILDALFKDALIRREGVTKWWWDDGAPLKIPIPAAEAKNLTKEDFFKMASDPEVIDLKPMPNEEGFFLYKATGRIKVDTVPSEEFVFSPDARNLDEANVVAHTRDVPASMLIQMGHSKKMIMSYVRATSEQGESSIDAMSQSDAGRLKDARAYESNESGVLEKEQEQVDLSQKLVRYTEAYVRVDTDNDGIAELRKFECLGHKYKILNGEGEEVSHAPFAIFTPIVEPHTIIGQSFHDLLGDIQLVKSMVERGMLNSMAKAIDPPMEVVPTDVDIQQLLTPELSNVIFVRKPGMVREIITEFIGPKAIQTLEYYNEKRADRVGVTRASEGLDLNALQSTTQEAVANTLTKSQEVSWMLAKIFGETGMKRMFLGILTLLVEHQNFSRFFKTANTKGYILADPRKWDAKRRVTVDVALGSGNVTERILVIERILNKQLELMREGAPIVSFVEVRNTLRRWTDAMGFKNTDEFFKPWTEEDDQQFRQQMAQQAQQQGAQDINAQLLQLEATKAGLSHQIEMIKIQIERMKTELTDDRERDKIAINATLKEREIEAKHDVDIKNAEFKRDVAAKKATMDAEAKVVGSALAEETKRKVAKETKNDDTGSQGTET